MNNLAKVKTFRFFGSYNEYKNSTFSNIKTNTEDIDMEINNFIKENVTELIDIKITTVECRWHNNGGYNNVDLIYTIIYK